MRTRQSMSIDEMLRQLAARLGIETDGLLAQLLLDTFEVNKVKPTPMLMSAALDFLHSNEMCLRVAATLVTDERIAGQLKLMIDAADWMRRSAAFLSQLCDNAGTPVPTGPAAIYAAAADVGHPGLRPLPFISKSAKEAWDSAGGDSTT